MNATAPTPPAVPSPARVAALVAALADALRARGWRIATAESCTGGLIAGACTDLAGSSDWFERGIVSYSNAAKTELLAVPAPLIVAHGAVSGPVAHAMAAGALALSRADLAVAVTGVAGPGGGSAAKPVGLVWLAWAWLAADGQVQTHAEAQHFDGDRAAVRLATVCCALQGLLDRAAAAPPSEGDTA
jgi:nicotinamide-nucleotide amidase